MLFDFSDENFINLMKNEALQLPRTWTGYDFGKTLNNEVYLEYKKLVETLISSEAYCEINKICNAIVDVISIYYDGFPAKAYTKFSEIMNILWNSPIKVYEKNIFGSNIYNDPLKLYRIRKVSKNKDYNREDIFHTPFTLRKHVSSCRYSIAGYPSLYLGTSLGLCSLEVSGSYEMKNGIASRFKLNRNYVVNGQTKIRVIEFAVKPSDFKKNVSDNVSMSNNGNYFNETNLKNRTTRSNYLLWYPLLAACSFICIKKSDSFHSEYIIPQLFVQWIRDNFSDNELFGIRYFTCRSKTASNKGLNYMFPTKFNNSDKKFCDILCNSLELTEPKYMSEYKDIKECEHALLNDENMDSINNPSIHKVNLNNLIYNNEYKY